jgi:hypothetical protein
MSTELPDSNPAAELAKSRAELQRLLDPEVKARDAKLEKTIEGRPNGHAKSDGDFPRSLTMKLLAGNRGVGTLLMMAFGAMAMKPRMAAKMLQYVPVSAIAKTLIARYIHNQGTKK